MTIFALLVATVLGIALVSIWLKLRFAARAEFIRTHTLPLGLFDKLRNKYPSLTLKDCQLVAHALRHYFLAHLKSGHKFVAMPSQVVDELWHEFILHTKHYAFFCNKAFGKFMHHTPAVVLSSSAQTNVGLRRCWWYVCLEENINPREATRLPLLFALDVKLSIPDGFRYSVDCKVMKEERSKNDGGGVVYCGSDFSSTSVDGSIDGFGNAISADGSSGDGGDCGGGGCGGGD
ncbi:MAG: hypothetical protein HY273_00995 [Gammaproteobacteria bacterium]|nr:hypothetical protein [Gammaproteobacteria bacterium]